MPYSDLSDAWNSYDPRYRRVTDLEPTDPFDKPVETYGGLLPRTVRESDLYMSNPKAPYEYVEPPAAGELPPHMRYPDEVLNLYRDVPRWALPEQKDPVYRDSVSPQIIPLPNNTLSNPMYNWRQDNPHSGRVISGQENPVIEEGPTPKGYQPGFGLISQGGGAAPPALQDAPQIQGPTRPGFNDPTVLARVYGDIQRDLRLNPDQALGFLSNLNAESFGFAKAQEEGPQIRGRNTGGLGWGQWTASRRAAFEDYLRQTGAPPTSYEGNYGFLTAELQDPKWQPFLENLRRQRDAESATRYTESGYENPSRKTGRQDWLARTRRELPASQNALGQVRGSAPPAPNSLEMARPYTSLAPNYLRPQPFATGSSELYRENLLF